MYADKSIGAVILAAGKSSRADGRVNKVYRELAGSAVLNHSLTCFVESGIIDQLVVVFNGNDAELLRERVVEGFNCEVPLEAVPGGERRQDSSWAGLNKVDTNYVFVHDGARPNFSFRLLKDLLDKAISCGASYPGLKPVDTVRRLEGGFSGETVDRDKLVRVQTPQCFEYDLLYDAIEKSIEEGNYYTDDAGAVMNVAKVKPAVVPGERGNIKLTTNEDFAVVEKFLRGDEG
ncbi:MAG: 2-C-methyl-D-erythritol 4-phosphate cytidylyltransferase [Candidatus Bipolaricaulota bacterium]